MAVTFRYPTGASLYVRFDDADNTAVTLTEGVSLKTGVYSATDGAITSASLDAGTYSAGIHVGTAGLQNSSDALVGTIDQFFWTGSAEQTSEEYYGALKPTTAGRTLDVTATGEAGIDWANIGSPTTTQTLSGTTVKTATDVETDTVNIQSRLPAALVSGRMDSNVGAISGDSTAADTLESYTDGTTPMPVNVTHYGGSTGTFASGRPQVNTTLIEGTDATDALDARLTAYGALKPTVAGRTLDVTTTGEAGIDLANIGSPTTTVNLSGLTIKTATDVETDTADIQTRLPAALAGGYMMSDVIAISGDTAAADALELYVDGTNYLPVDVVKVDGLPDSGYDTIAAAGREALGTYNLDKVLFNSADGGDVHTTSVLGRMMSSTGLTGHTPATDSQAAHRARVDEVYTAVDHNRLVSTVIASLGSQTSFTLSAGSADDDAYNDQTIVIIDASTNAQRSVGVVDDYVGLTKTITLTSPPSFTIATADTVAILPTPPGTLAPTAAAIADAVWDEVATDHSTAGTTGDKLLDAAAGSGGGGTGGPIENTPVPDEFTWVVPARGSTNLAGTKTVYIQPTEKLLCAMDFTALLQPGDSLSTIVAVTEHAAQSVTLTDIGVCANLAKFWIEDADALASYRIECRVTTRFGLTLEGDGLCVVGD
jgi:hypothetical protein